MEIGIGFRVHMNYPNFKTFMDFLANNNMTAEDASEALWEIRSIKSQREIEIMRKVCAINCALFEKAFASVIPRVTTERDIYRIMGREAFSLGCDTILDMGIRSGVDRDPHTNCPSSDRVIGGGHEREVLMIDGGPVYKGYYSDIIRTGVVGKPSKFQLERHEIATEACYTALRMIKPGVVMGEITKAVDDFIDAKGFGDCNKTYNWIGHGIGLDVHEYPCFEIGEKRTLAPGMCFAVEPCICDEYGMFGIEQNILVTENGYELLSPMRHDLFTIGW
jgi:Xaa-Pro aminopeptidase